MRFVFFLLSSTFSPFGGGHGSWIGIGEAGALDRPHFTGVTTSGVPWLKPIQAAAVSLHAEPIPRAMSVGHFQGNVLNSSRSITKGQGTNNYAD
jgi:hypothetical protein